MAKLKINGRELEVEAGTMLVDAVLRAGGKVPTLCHLNGYAHFTSCMVCVVKELNSGKLLPACSAPVADGMVIETDTEEVRHARRSALDLLLSEHVGDCEAPCRITCPAHMNIPLMIRLIGDGRMREAVETVKEDLALPAVLGRICPAPCEKACRRSRRDSSLAICLLKRFVADDDLAGRHPYLPACRPASGRRAVIVGAGPAGLSAAYYLAVAGHRCVVLDERAEPGGQLRYGVTENVLPRKVLDAEIDVIRQLGVEFRMKTRVCRDVLPARLREEYDVVLLAPGRLEAGVAAGFGVACGEKGVKVEPHTFRASEEGVFAGGEAVQQGRLAVRASAHGKAMAEAADQFLRGQPVLGPRRRFESRMGRVADGEVAEFMKGAASDAGVEPAGGAAAGYTAEEALRESRRCMHCDCRKQDDCRLRDYAEEYGASQKHYNVEGRRTFERVTTHSSVIYEPGKCIKCGLCVRISEKAGEPLGLAFKGRGFDSVVGVPFGESLGAGLQVAAGACVRNCPTAALSFRDGSK